MKWLHSLTPFLILTMAVPMTNLEAAKPKKKSRSKTVAKAGSGKSAKVATAAAAAAAASTAATEPSLPKSNIDRTTPPPAGPLPAVAPRKVLSETLANGLRVIILPDHRQPTVTYRLVIKSGSVFDGDKPGTAALVASLLNKGTEQLSADEFAQQTDFLGLKVEAGSSEDALSITATGLSRDNTALLEFLKAAALSPAFKPEELEKERVRAITELVQKRANPGDLALRLRNKLLYGTHPYGAITTPESVKAITRDDLLAFHKAHFLPNNASLVLVGDVEPEAALEEIKKTFGDWKKGEVPTLKVADGVESGDPRFVLPAFPEVKGVTYHLVDRPSSVQSNVLVASRGVPRNNPDLPELSVVNSLLGGGFSGRLFGNLREKHGYTYGAYSAFGPRKLGGVFSATAEVRNEVTGAASTEILKELERITTEPIPEEELGLQRNYLAGNFLISQENDKRIAERLQEIDLFGLPADYYDTYAQRLNGVTPEAAAALAKKYIHPKDLVVVVVGSAKEVLPQLQALGPVTVYDQDLNPVEPPKKD